MHADDTAEGLREKIIRGAKAKKLPPHWEHCVHRITQINVWRPLPITNWDRTYLYNQGSNLTGIYNPSLPAKWYILRNGVLPSV
jgi:hypothetical protein